jgi:hypothetical protein
LKRLRKLIADTGIICSWPKKSSGVVTDVTKTSLRGRVAAWFQTESLRRGRDVVRIETDDSARKSALTHDEVVKE